MKFIKNILLGLSLLSSIVFSQSISRYNNGESIVRLTNIDQVIALDGVDLTEVDSSLIGLVASWDAANENEIDSVVFHYTGASVVSASNDTMIVDDGTGFIIGESIRVGSPLTGSVYFVKDTLGSRDSLLLYSTITASLNDKIYAAYLDDINDVSTSLNHATESDTTKQALALWLGTDTVTTYYDGNDFYSLSNDLALSIDTSVYSILFVSDRSALGANQNVLGASATASYRFLNFTTTGRLLLETNVNGDAAQGNITDDLNRHHYVVTFDSGTMLIYEDGIKLAMLDSLINNPITLNQIGQAGAGFNHNGSLDDIKIYSRIITDSEIQRYYENSRFYNQILYSLLLRMPDDISDSEQLSIDNTIKSLVDNSLWSKINTLQVYATGSKDNSLINWKGDYSNASVIDTSQFSEAIGWTGDEIDAYVNTGLNLQSLSSENNQLTTYIRKTNSTSDSQIGMGVDSTYYKYNSGGFFKGKYAGKEFSLASSSPGFFSARINTGILTIENNGIKKKINITPVFSSDTLFMNAHNNIAASNYSEATTSMLCYSESMSDAEFLTFKGIMTDHFESLNYWDYTSIIEERSGESQADNYDYFVSALEDNNKILIPENSELTVSQPVYFSTGDTIALNGGVKIKDGTETTLTEDVLIGDTILHLTSLTGFNVGELVTIYDTNNIFSQDMYRGTNTEIISKSGDSLIVRPSMTYDMSVDKNATIGHQQTPFIIADIDSVLIKGKGYINGNGDNQIDAYGAWDDIVNITEYGGHCILVRNSRNVTIEGIDIDNKIEFYNGSLQNICLFERDDNINQYITFRNLYSHNARFKNILVAHTEDVYCYNIVSDSAFDDDGLIFYAYVKRATVNNYSATGNDRWGLAWNSNYNDTLWADSIITSGNGHAGVHLASRYVFLNDTYSSDRFNIWNTYDAQYMTLDNINLTGVVSDEILHMVGYVRDVDITNLTINNCNGTGISATSGIGDPDLQPIRVTIDYTGIYNHTGLTNSLESGSDVVITNFTGL